MPSLRKRPLKAERFLKQAAKGAASSAPTKPWADDWEFSQAGGLPGPQTAPRLNASG